MLSPLRNRAYCNLFMAQVAALLGTGVATVALSLLAHDIAGANSGEVLGIVLAIKMIAYVCVAPVASALAHHFPRRTLLIGLDIARAAVAIALPFVSEAWHVFGMMTVLYVASAAFTPAFQSMIPDVLTDEREYTKALSLSRLASDLESVASPVVAALLLAVTAYNNLFAGTAAGFAISAVLVLVAKLPEKRPAHAKPFLQRLTVGFRLFAQTPRLRGLFAISLATAAGGAMVFVNTVAIVQTALQLGTQETAWALAVFGAGSMLAAVLLPSLLDAVSDRLAVVTGGAMMTVVLAIGAFRGDAQYTDLLFMWFAMGVGYSLTVTPGGRVLRRSSGTEDRPALFAANFTLSHVCWLIAYPAAGFIGVLADQKVAFLLLAGICGSSVLLTWLVWPASDPNTLLHTHDDLPVDHPHLVEHGVRHEHPVVIDAWHPSWPKRSE
ncbi:MAG: MFS transporter [Alphaproteobacteria bacterium 32-64-14]|nr:MAG: MFS transporter [Alphaproteobacteria bacterium 32-64-14]